LSLRKSNRVIGRKERKGLEVNVAARGQKKGGLFAPAVIAKVERRKRSDEQSEGKGGGNTLVPTAGTEEGYHPNSSNARKEGRKEVPLHTLLVCRVRKGR